jgi:hypothetical protein
MPRRCLLRQKARKKDTHTQRWRQTFFFFLLQWIKTVEKEQLTRGDSPTQSIKYCQSAESQLPLHLFCGSDCWERCLLQVWLGYMLRSYSIPRSWKVLSFPSLFDDRNKLQIYSVNFYAFKFLYGHPIMWMLFHLFTHAGTSGFPSALFFWELFLSR